MKHTPGPWESYNHYVWTADKTNIANCKVVQEGSPITVEESYANARLIATAPSLLKALKDVLKYDGGAYDLQPYQSKKIMKLIAKAEGGLK